MSEKPKHRVVGSLLAPRVEAEKSDSARLSEALSRQSDSLALLARAITTQKPPQVTVEAPEPRRYLITVNKDKDRQPVSYLVEPLASNLNP